MRISLAGICMLVTFQLQAQYYLQHLVVAERSTEQFKLLKRHQIKKVVASGTQPDGTPSENFLLEQIVDAANNRVITSTQSNFTGQSLMISTYNDRGQVMQVVDSSASIVNRSTYTYNDKGQLTHLSMQAADSMQQYTLQEVYELEYDTKGFPSGMRRIKNQKDTLQVIFIASENGKPGEEHWWQNKRQIETWYYYYDAQGRLTDVARFNRRANQVIPDYLYEYDQQNRVAKQTSVQGVGNYRIWQYQYDARGLKSKEMVFNKSKQLEGIINYSYQ